MNTPLPSESPATTSHLLRRPEVERRTSLSRSRLYALIAEGAFPRPVRTGANSVAWVAGEVDGWIAARIRERG